MQKFFLPCVIGFSLIGRLSSSASDASFDLSTSTTSQYSLGAGQTGTIEKTGSLNYSGSNPTITVDNTSNGSSAITITNNGLVDNTNTGSGQNGRDIRITGTGVTLTINNSATGTLETSNADVIQGAESDSNVTVNNYGVIDAQNTPSSQVANFGDGQQGVDLNKVTTGSTTVNNYTGATIEAYDSDAVRPGVNGYVYNDGTIESTEPTGDASGNDGIDAQSNSSVTIVNGSAIAGDATGTALISGARHGITGGNTGVSGGAVQYGGYLGTGSYSMTITNNQGALIEGDDGSGINIDGFGIQNGTTFYTNENVTVTNYGTITGSGQTRDGDGIDVDGDVTINNQGSVISENATPEAGSPAGSIEFSEGITVGGGTITNGSVTNSAATIEGEVAAGNTEAVGRGITLAGIDHDTNDVAFPIESIYENSSITNSGIIKGDSESGIAVLGTTGGGYSVTITNNATGNIIGNNTGVSERTNVTYNSVISPNGQSLNQGAIELDDTGDTYEVDNYGTITQDGASGIAVEMHSATSNVLNVYGGAINGDVAGDTAGDSNLTFDVGASSTGSFNFSHNISNFAVNVKSGSVQFSGTISNTGATTVSGGKLDITGSMLDSATTVQSAGQLLGDGSAGAVTVKSGGIARAGDSATMLASTQAAGTNYKFSLTGLTVDGGSTLTFDLDHTAAGTGTTNNPAGGTMFDLGLSGLFAAGANVTPGSVLLNFDGSTVGGTVAAPNVYELVAFASGGTTLTASDFTVQNLSVDGTDTYSLGFVTLSDGQEALDLTVAPEPGTWTMLIGGLGLLVAVGRWRKLSS